ASSRRPTMGTMRRLLLVLLLALALPSTASAAYSWPLRPFNKQHPIRGFDGPGFFSFHQGIDIAAPNGTPVYPVMSGTAHYLGAETMNVAVGKVNGVDTTFQYFHITPIVGEGAHVIARKTVIGYVARPYGHVH